ncbi:hypothetical protein P303_03860 [Xylella fastidiosa MUL0034]|nr:hypothetical protein P303_03860 [Xylella fastidiosa MUL0034]
MVVVAVVLNGGDVNPVGASDYVLLIFCLVGQIMYRELDGDAAPARICFWLRTGR